MSDSEEKSATSLYLSFLLDNEEYGVDILRVQEVRGWAPVTRIPNAPDYLKGVLNLRGDIIPVIDLRERFGFTSRPYDEKTVVIVVTVLAANRQRSMGIVVDAVAETYEIDKEQLATAPLIGGAINPEFIQGLVTVNETMVVMLDLDRLMNAGALACEEI